MSGAIDLKFALALTIALEGIMQVTYRQESTTQNVKLLSTGSETNSPKFLDSVNISETICNKLTQGKEFGGAVGYLFGCYRRLNLKETSCDDKIRRELVRLVIHIFPLDNFFHFFVSI